MILIIILFIIFVIVGAGDCWSTAKMLRYNRKMVNDINFRRRMQRKINKSLKEDNANAEMCKIPRKLMKKYGEDRTLLYLYVLGYQPMALFLLYFMLTDNDSLLLGIFLVGMMVGVLYRQILKAITLRKFGVEI